MEMSDGRVTVRQILRRPAPRRVPLSGGERDIAQTSSRVSAFDPKRRCNDNTVTRVSPTAYFYAARQKRYSVFTLRTGNEAKTSGSDISEPCIRELTDALTEVLAENSVSPARPWATGQGARCRQENMQNTANMNTLLTVETAFTRWEIIRKCQLARTGLAVSPARARVSQTKAVVVGALGVIGRYIAERLIEEVSLASGGAVATQGVGRAALPTYRSRPP